MEVCLINFNKGKDDEKVLKCESPITTDNSVKNIIHLVLQPIEPIGKSNTGHTITIKLLL